MNENEKKDLVPQAEEPVTESVADTAAQDMENEIAAPVEEAAQETVEENGGKEKTAKKGNASKRLRFNTRKLRFGSMATVLTVVLVAALVLVSVVGDVLNDRYPLSIDLTADKTYTFSEKSEKVAELVDRDIEIVVFMDEDVFQNPSTEYKELDVVIKQFYEFTKKYNSLTDGKVKVTYLDPTNNPTVYAPYEKYGVEDSNSILMIAGDRYRTVALDSLYEIEQTYYSSEITASNVESILAANLQYLCRKEITTVAILTGHNEYSGAIDGATELLETNGYEVKQHDYTTAAELPETTTALVIAAPSKDYSEDEIQRMRTWLNNEDAYGRHLIVLLHPTASCPNLYDFLREEYYIEVGENLVLETELENVFAGFSTPSDYTYTSLLSSDYATDLTGRLVFPSARQITALRENDTEYSQYVVPLAAFSDSAKYYPIPRQDENSSAAKEEIELIDPEDTAHGMLMSVFDSYNNDLDVETKTYVLVSGSAQFLTDGIRDAVSTAANEQFFLNIANSVLGNEDAIAVYAKDLTADTLEYSTTTQLVLGLVVFTIAVPAVMLIICLVVFIKRRHL